MARAAFILVFFLLTEQMLLAQALHVKGIRVVSFKELEPLLHLKSDTVYLVNFWATWCAPCVKELPAIQAVEKKYADKKFKVLLVSLDMPSQLNSRLIPFIRTNKITSAVVLLDDPDQNSWIDKVDKNWSGEIPYTLIYGNKFRDSYTQAFSYQTLDSIINRKIKMP
ncbi:MAG: redoxin domain-containing protein [Verrucomicrobia bacterium]|nr:redoxin domain-containing protein [Prolixibacteraceae bacterium]